MKRHGARAHTRGIPGGMADSVLSGDLRDPFAVLGPHFDRDAQETVIRVFRPGADAVAVLDRRSGTLIGALDRSHGDGLFIGTFPRLLPPYDYRLRVLYGDTAVEMEDPYRFGPWLGELDCHLLAEGTHLTPWTRLGAHPATLEGVDGTVFSVWAPNARRVSVVGDFNGWDGRVHPMRLHPGCGVWEIFVPGIGPGALYKYELKARDGHLLPLKSDPYAFYAEKRPATASIVHGLQPYDWQDGAWMDTRRRDGHRLDGPVSIYELHAGSWKRVPEEGNRFLTWAELADQLVPYVRDLGFTHIELLPVHEHPFDGSWGYQPGSLFAPTSRYGTPEEFKAFIDACHRAGLGVIIDWVPGHFPTDAHALGWFDGTHLYEHSDPRQGRHMDWGTLIYNFGRTEVQHYLIANALYWCREFHIDGLRVDAVASMLYLDYSRKAGEWVPNRHGGNENLEAIAFLRRLNEVVFAHGDGATTMAEESTAWPMVSRPTSVGGLGFGYKWNMGWMHDTLDYFKKDPVHRRWHHNQLTFGLMYAFSENFVLPFSHDEVVHGKSSLFGRMNGDRWQKFANLRAMYAMMWAHPGKKLLFMGGEFGQVREWNHDASLDWHLLDDPLHRGVQGCLTALNSVYRRHPALHQQDFGPQGFDWVDCQDADNSVLSWLRWSADGQPLLAVCNLTPVVRRGYRIGVPSGGWWAEVLNTDSHWFGGSGQGNDGGVTADAVSCHGRPASLALTLPPLSVLYLTPEG